MLLRTPRRRISPRSKRRCRVIRNFFLRALGTSSQQDLKINSSIALNVTDINHKIKGIEKQLNTISRHCRAQSCSVQESQESDLCLSDEDYITVDPYADKASRKTSDTTTYLHEPSVRDSQGNRQDMYNPIDHHNTSHETDITLLDNAEPELRAPCQPKVRKKKNKLDDRKPGKFGTEDDCDQTLHKHRTQSALETVTPAYIDSTCLLSPQPGAPKGPRARHRRDSDRIEPPPPGDDTYTTKQKDAIKQQRSPNLQRLAKKKNVIPIDNQRFTSSKAKSSYHQPRVDRDFIEKLVKKQYLTTRIIGGRRSSMSQYSEPVCRDFSARVTDELYSSVYEPYERYEPYALEPQSQPPPRRRRCPDSRSACDARSLPARRARSRPCCTHYDPYNDSDLYDMVPVREKKRSPKPRRKYVDYDSYREVPPSPRTLRPRLNLEAQLHADYEEYMNSRQHKASTPVPQHRKLREYIDSDGTDVTFELKTRRQTKLLKPVKVQTCLPVPDKQVTPPVSNSLQCGNSNELETSHGTNANNTAEEDISRKTDKTLCEIKDILQNFLEEIKMETFQADKLNETKIANAGNQTGRNAQNMASVQMVPGATSCAPETFNMSNPQPFITDVNNPQLYMPGMSSPQAPMPITTNPLPQIPAMSGPLPPMPYMKCPLPSPCDGPLMMPRPQTGNTFNTYTVAHCSVPTTFPPNLNTCCYPTMPGCPVGCANTNLNSNDQYPPASSGSHVIHPGNTASNVALCQHCSSKKESNTEMERSVETEELIKEIYKFVTLNPMRSWDKQKTAAQMTSRSVGSSHRAHASRHDVTVGTSAMRCYSKSCEAIGSRMITETSYSTRSDTMIEKLSLDMSQSDTELPEAYVKREQQVKKKKTFTNVLKSMFKKKKSREAFESTTDETYGDMQASYEGAPFRQEFMNYMMTGQEFDKTPPSQRGPGAGFVPPPPGCEHRGPYYRAPSPPPAPRAPHFPRPHYLSTPSSSTYTPHHLHGQVIPEYETPYPPPGYPYYNHYDRSSYTQPPYADHTAYTDQTAYTDHPPYSGHTQYTDQTSYQDPRLCLREVEVKSTGTQSSSDKKIPFLHKLSRKMSPPPPRFSPRPEAPAHHRNPIPPQAAPPPQPNKLLSKWKQFQEKVQKDINNDPVAYGISTQSKLLTANKNMRKDVLKKMFFKKNPFSPNNLIIRTLLGNDPSSFGVPQGTMRPRLIL